MSAHKHAALILLAVLLSGCGFSGDEIQHHIEVCEENGGLRTIYYFPVTESWCENGAQFSAHSVKKYRDAEAAR